MDIRQLQNFIEVCRHMSFTKAAQSVYISQQGISKSVRALEDELGVQLFSRNQSSISLTEYGTALLKHARVICKEYDSTLAEIAGMKAQNASDIRVGIPYGLANFLPPRLLSEFAATHPSVSLSVDEYDDYGLDTALAGGELDIGLCIDPVAYDNLVIHHTHVETTYFMLSENHPLADRKVIDLRDLKNESFIAFGKTTKGHVLFEERCRKAGFSPAISVRTKDMQFIYKLVRSGMGIGFFVGNPDTVIPGIRIIPDILPNWKYTVHVCTAEGHCINSNEADLLEAISEW